MSLPSIAQLAGGTDGVDLRALKTDDTGQLLITLAEVTASGGIVIQGVDASSGVHPVLVGNDYSAGAPAPLVISGLSGEDTQLATSGPSFRTGAGSAYTAVLVGMTQDGGHARTSIQGDDSGFLYVNLQAVGGGVTVPVTNAGGGAFLPVVGSTAAGVAASQDPVLVGGTDGTDVRTLLTDTGGQLMVLVENSVAVTGTFYQATQPVSNSALTAMTFSGSALEVDVTNSTSIAVTNTGLTSLAAAIQATGSAIPADVVMAGASDGTDSRALLVDGSGYLKVNVAAGGSGGGAVWGPNASGAAPTEDPVLNAGWDGTDVRTLFTDSSGQLKVLVENSPTVAVSGSVTVVGDAASGSAVAGNPVLMGGSDGTDARTLLTDVLGNLSVIKPLSQVLAANTNVTPSSTVSSESATAGVSGACVAVTVACSLTSTSQNPDNICVRVRDTTTGIIGPWQSAGLLWGTQSSTLYFNVPIFKGDTVVIDIIAPAGSFTGSKNNFSAVILGDPSPVTLRADGRGLPLGTQFVQNVATSAANVLAAPAAGFRYLVAACGVYPAAVSTSASPVGTMNGSSVTLGPTATTGTTVTAEDAENFFVFPAGILVDPATAITNGWAAGTAVINLFYDIVPI